MNSGSATHEDRTASEQRGTSIYRVILDRIELVNEDVKLMRLRIPERQQIEASRGQWLDVHIDGLRQAGGFTITSTPEEAEASVGRDPEDGYLELAIQKAPQNPPAAWLWRPESEILGSSLLVRVGGSFVWPPQGIDPRGIKRVVFVAGGVGINPLVSIVSYLRQHPHSNIPSIDFFYTTRYPASNDLASVLFLTRLRSLFDDLALSDTKLRLYLTRSPNNAKSGLTDSAGERPLNSSFLDRVCFNRIARKDLVDALGPPSERSGIVAYVCGVPPMTDQFVNLLQGAEGMDRRRVRCEKWW